METREVRLTKNGRRSRPATTSRDLSQIWNTKFIFVRAGEKVTINPQGKGLGLVWEKTS